VVAVFPATGVKETPSVLHDHVPVVKPVLDPLVANVTTGSSNPVIEKDIVMKEPLPALDTRLRLSSVGSEFKALMVEPAKSSTKPVQGDSPMVPLPWSAEIVVGTPPDPGADAVAIESPLKFQYATRAASDWGAKQANNEIATVGIRQFRLLIGSAAWRE